MPMMDWDKAKPGDLVSFDSRNMLELLVCIEHEHEHQTPKTWETVYSFSYLDRTLTDCKTMTRFDYIVKMSQLHYKLLSSADPEEEQQEKQP